MPEPLEGIIFDRDGVLIFDMHHLSSPDQIRWVPGALDLIRLLNQNSVKVMVATNQSGVARGYFSENNVKEIHEVIQKILKGKGLWIDAIEYCPHHPTEGCSPYTISCECRKPNPGMLIKLLKRCNLNPHRTLMVGDRETDMQAAVNAGIEGFLFKGANLLRELENSAHLKSLSVVANTLANGVAK